jgi:hypothetical protein
MKILVFCPTAPRLEPEVVNAIFNQEGVEFYDVMFTRDNPYEYEFNQVYRNIQLNYEKMKRVVLNEGYAKVWIVESDTIPPKDALKKMLEVDAPVVSALYALRHGEPIPNLMRAGKNMPGTGEALTWEEVFTSENIVDVSGGCMGCLLVDRSVLENFSFEDENNRSAPDVPFMQFCWSKKIPQKARLDVVCGHKKRTGETIWPDPKSEKGWRLN